MKMIVMLIWVGVSGHGGPATIQGFESVAACEAARPVVAQGFHTNLGFETRITMNCVELSR